MKKLITLIILLNTVLFFPALASHLKGGEITWTCQGNGQYRFYLKLYRDCNGIPLGTTQSLCTQGGCPVTNIPLNLIASNDLTPPGCGNSCANPNNFGISTQEFIFQSNPVTLSGTPPATGWIFVWDVECCRNLTDNLSGGTGQMALRSIMYPDPGNPQTNPCFASSPRFTYRPVSAICPGYAFSYNAMAIDNYGDSLNYGFDYPTDGGNCGPLQNLGFQFPFSVNSPMPGNPSINPITGEFIVFPTSAVAGNYTICTRVDAYRCGVIIASVFREIQFTISSTGCTVVCNGTGNAPNSPPQITPAPFQNPVTNNYTDYADTVLVGDTVSFTLNVTDFETLSPGCTSFQSFWLDAAGSELDAGSTFPFVNCEQPPCAYFDFTAPAGPFTIAKPVHFTWITSCDHVSNECDNEYTNYFFEINAKDDACPAPGLNSKTFEVSVRGLHIIANGDTLSVNTPYTNLQWYLNGNLIPGATDDTIITSASGGYYTVQALTPAGCSIESNRIGIVHVGSDEMSSSLNNLILYPNPASGILHVEIESQVAASAQLKITDGLGREVKQELIQLNNGNNSLTVKTNSLRNGIYFLSVKGKEHIYSKRIIVMH